MNIVFMQRNNLTKPQDMNRCPRCKQLLFVAHDTEGDWVVCVSCGYERPLDNQIACCDSSVRRVIERRPPTKVYGFGGKQKILIHGQPSSRHGIALATLNYEGKTDQ